MMAGIVKRRGLRDFVPGNFPEPYNPIWQASLGNLRDFVSAEFPEPYNPIYPDTHTGIRGIGCGGSCGGTCSGCGMGAIAVPAWAATLPAPLNGVDPVLSVPWVYWGLGIVGVVVVLPMISGKKGRR
jgi:hypothetical protein